LINDRCAKCGKKKNRLISMGEGSYGMICPKVCEECFIKWINIWNGHRPKREKGWKKLFEKWIGYEWNPENPNSFGKETVVFS